MLWDIYTPWKEAAQALCTLRIAVAPSQFPSFDRPWKRIYNCRLFTATYFIRFKAYYCLLVLE